ncbi:hypothetical protein AVEN_208253-1 [Araneus ventricosus]|uniref:Uncharacterized protein n=1 Tax=Araneus ventricosus TaxID=182803 RepID=A0A4Y2LQS0_ARAVE|nr:hypothetical protein AVEN_208253-1 [Araneus ventricosus]
MGGAVPPPPVIVRTSYWRGRAVRLWLCWPLGPNLSTRFYCNDSHSDFPCALAGRGAVFMVTPTSPSPTPTSPSPISTSPSPTPTSPSPISTSPSPTPGVRVPQVLSNLDKIRQWEDLCLYVRTMRTL